MPHVIITGPVSVERFTKDFKPATYRDTEIIRFVDTYLSSGGEKALVETVVVESGISRRFFIDVHGKPEGVGVRLEPMTDPEKTDGIRRALALVARRILEQSPEARIEKTNIGQFLEQER